MFKPKYFSTVNPLLKQSKSKVKRALTPFNIFTSEIYKKKSDELKALPFGERSAVISREWKLLPSAELERIEAVAEKDRKRYLIEKEEELKNGPPKRPSTAYTLFFSSIRDEIIQENPSLSFGEIGKLAGEKWKALADSDKEIFKQEYAKAKATYDEKLAAYKSK